MSGVVPVTKLDNRAGPMVRYAEDLAYMLDLLDSTIPSRPYYTHPNVLNENGLNGLRIGVPNTAHQILGSVDPLPYTWNVTSEVKRLFYKFVYNSQRAGATINNCNLLTMDKFIGSKFGQNITRSKNYW